MPGPTPPNKRRGPRPRNAPSAAALVRQTANQPGLSRERIVDAALEIVATDGLAGLSTRKLGQRLGCEAMSIYHHFPGKPHLMDAMVDRAIDSLDWPPAALSPLDALRFSMHAFRAMARRYPALFPLIALHRLNTPSGVRFIEGILALVQAVLPEPEKAARHFRTLGYFLVGAALDETAGYANGPSAAAPVDNQFLARECPRLVASARWFQREEWDATFALGVEAMLAAVQRDALPG